MKRFVIYSVIVAAYDNVLQPLVVDDRFDYVLFSDKTNIRSIGIWQVESIPYSNSDLTRLSRYPKMHPEELLAEYEASLYIDANIQITGQYIYDRVAELYKSGIDWAGIQHPYRDCIYDEAYVVYGLDTEANIFRWCHHLREEKYPRHQGLYENNIIFRRHNDTVNRVDSAWWNLYEQYTRRDQLILCYVLWKMPEIKTALLLSSEESAWKSDIVQIHKHSTGIVGQRSLDQSFWEHARCRCRVGMREKEARFKEFHYWLYGLNPTIARVILYIWGIYTLVVYGPIIKYRSCHNKKNGR